MTKFVDVSHVQAGDELVMNQVHYAVEYVEPNGIAFDMQLQSEQGGKIRKCFTVGEMVSITI